MPSRLQSLPEPNLKGIDYKAALQVADHKAQIRACTAGIAKSTERTTSL